MLASTQVDLLRAQNAVLELRPQPSQNPYCREVPMHRDHRVFIEAIKQKKRVRLILQSSTNSCVHTYGPVFYVPPAGGEDSDRYYVWNFNDNSGRPLFGLSPSEIGSIESSEESFELAGFNISDTHPNRIHRKS